MRRSVLLLSLALLWGGCGPVSDAPSAPALSGSIADGAHAGNPHFYWLPPLVRAPSPTGVFDGSLAPVVTICEGTDGPLIAEFSMTTGPGSETVRVDVGGNLYIVNWHTNRFNLSDQINYRIRVLVNGIELGHADVDVVSSGRQLKNVDAQQFVALVDGRTLPIKFRIEEGAVHVNAPPTLDAIADPAPIDENAGLQTVNLSGITAGPGESQALTVSATSSNPALVPNPTVDYTSPNATGSLHYTPAANQSGSALITVTVQDDGGTANGGVNTTSRTFTVTVTPLVVTTVRWINPDGGDWNTASNWSTGVLPTAGQDVIIDIAVTSPVTHSAGTTAIKSLTSNQPFALAGGTMTIVGALSVDNDVSLTGGSVTTGGDITLNVPGNLSIASTIKAGGSISLNAPAGALGIVANVDASGSSLTMTSTTLTIATGAQVLSADGAITTGNLTNAGRLSLGASGQAIVTGNFVNVGSGVLQVDIASTSFTQFMITGSSTLNGTLKAALVGGFAPAVGERFRFMTFGSRTGVFGFTNLPTGFTVDFSNPAFLELVSP